VSGILAREGELLLSTEPTLIIGEELRVDVVEYGIVARVVVVSNVE